MSRRTYRRGEAQIAQKLICVNEHANVRRLIEWIKNPNRRPASCEFTEGPERQLAYWIDQMIYDEKKRAKEEPPF